MVGVTFLFISVLLFSTMEISSKFISSDFNFLQLTFLRFFQGIFIFIFFILLNKDLKKELGNLKMKSFIKISSLGFINVFLSMVLLQYSVEKGNASVAAVLIGSHPIFVYILNLIFSKEFDRTKLFKILTGIIGISLLLLFSKKINRIDYLSSFAGLLSSFFFALFTFLSKKFLKDNSPVIINFISFFSGILFLLPFFFYKKNHLLNFNSFNIPFLLYLGFIVTGFGYLLYYEGFKRLNVVDGSIFFFLKPLIATTLSVILLKEKLSLIQIFGIFLIILSLTDFKKEKKIEIYNGIKKDIDS